MAHLLVLIIELTSWLACLSTRLVTQWPVEYLQMLNKKLGERNWMHLFSASRLLNRMLLYASKSQDKKYLPVKAVYTLFWMYSRQSKLVSNYASTEYCYSIHNMLGYFGGSQLACRGTSWPKELSRLQHDPASWTKSSQPEKGGQSKHSIKGPCASAQGDSRKARRVTEEHRQSSVLFNATITLYYNARFFDIKYV